MKFRCPVAARKLRVSEFRWFRRNARPTSVISSSDVVYTCLVYIYQDRMYIVYQSCQFTVNTNESSKHWNIFCRVSRSRPAGKYIKIISFHLCKIVKNSKYLVMILISMHKFINMPAFVHTGWVYILAIGPRPQPFTLNRKILLISVHSHNATVRQKYNTPNNKHPRYNYAGLDRKKTQKLASDSKTQPRQRESAPA